LRNSQLQAIVEYTVEKIRMNFLPRPLVF